MDIDTLPRIFPRRSAPSSQDRTDIEPQLVEMLDAKLLRWCLGPYRACSLDDAGAGLARLFAAHDQGDVQITGLRRLSGGSSKEQFVFEVTAVATGNRERLVLRMDPRGGTVETLRSREAEAICAVADKVPVPPVAYLDADGSLIGQPAVITRWVEGVTSPSSSGSGLSGLGTQFPQRLREQLAPQFIGHLAAIHALDFRQAQLPSFSVPDADPWQPALWQVNFWSRIWKDDRGETSPLFALTEAWLRENLPICDAPVFLHGDYRMGNFMFDEDSGGITAVLDWELAHIGDFHEDIAYNLQPVFGLPSPDGNLPVGGMFDRQSYLGGYESATGRTINPDTLHFYDVLNTYKLAVMNHASAASAARECVNHQNVYLSYISAISHILAADLPALIRGKRR